MCIYGRLRDKLHDTKEIIDRLKGTLCCARLRPNSPLSGRGRDRFVAVDEGGRSRRGLSQGRLGGSACRLCGRSFCTADARLGEGLGLLSLEHGLWVGAEVTGICVGIDTSCALWVTLANVVLVENQCALEFFFGYVVGEVALAKRLRKDETLQTVASLEYGGHAAL